MYSYDSITFFILLDLKCNSDIQGQSVDFYLNLMIFICISGLDLKRDVFNRASILVCQRTEPNYLNKLFNRPNTGRLHCISLSKQCLADNPNMRLLCFLLCLLSNNLLHWLYIQYQSSSVITLTRLFLCRK